MARLRRLTPVERWQKKDDPIRAMAEGQEKKIKAALHEALKHLGSVVPVEKVAALLKRGGTARDVVGAIPFAHWREVLKGPMGHLGDLYLDAGVHAGKQIHGVLQRSGGKVRYHRWLKRPYLDRVAHHLRKQSKIETIFKAAGDGFDFDRFDENTQRRLRDITNGLIDDLSTSAKETINAVVLDGVRAGDSFDDIAKNVRDTISLTPSQAQAVANYRRELEDLDPAALKRALRDAGLDTEVQDAIDSGDFLTDSFMDDAVNSYLDNYLDYRANTIARTESLRAGNSGLLDGYQQAADRGVFPAAAVTRQWQAAIDERTCPVCMSIVENNPNGVGLDEQFQSDDGPVDDPPVHPNCRCTVQYETDLDMVPATDEEAA